MDENPRTNRRDLVRRAWRQARRLSLAVWLFPLCALGLSGWLALEYWRGRGALVEIRFPDAANIEAERTPIKYRGVVVGRVEDVELTPELGQVVVRARMQKRARALVVKGTRFQLVEPQVGLSGVRGLETLFKGVYIELLPGPKDAPTERKFTGHQTSVSPFASGARFRLRSREIDSIGEGDPVYYRGIKVGQVADVGLGKDGRYVETQIRISRALAHVVRANTKFWVKRAVQADVGLLGASVQISAMEALMKGGIQLATPDPAGPRAKAGEVFELLGNEPKNWREWSPDLRMNAEVAGR